MGERQRKVGFFVVCVGGIIPALLAWHHPQQFFATGSGMFERFQGTRKSGMRMLEGRRGVLRIALVIM